LTLLAIRVIRADLLLNSIGGGFRYHCDTDDDTSILHSVQFDSLEIIFAHEQTFLPDIGLNLVLFSEMSSLENSNAVPEGVQDMVAVETRRNGMNGSRAPNRSVHHNGVNGHSSETQRHNPYAPRASEFLNNVSNFKIIESTLRGFDLNLFEASFRSYDVVQRGSNLPMPFSTPRPR
jgi:hypothetical protein